jgi:hypothetical protein
MASTPVTANGTACTMRVLRRFRRSSLELGLGLDAAAEVASIDPSDKLLLVSSIALFKLPLTCKSLVNKGFLRPLAARPRNSISRWSRGQRTRHRIETHFPRIPKVGAGLAQDTPRVDFYAGSNSLCSAPEE